MHPNQKATIAAGEDVSSDLAYLPESSKYLELYKNEMNYCLESALANRTLKRSKIAAFCMPFVAVKIWMKHPDLTKILMK